MARSVLCVEGRGDEVVLQSLIEHYQPVLPDVTIERRDGKDGVLKTLRAQLPIRDDKQYTAIGIIIDADDDLANTWTRCCDTLRRNGYDALPGTPDPIGTILSASERPTVGFWLMPDNQNIGRLNNLSGRWCQMKIFSGATPRRHWTHCPRSDLRRKTVRRRTYISGLPGKTSQVFRLVSLLSATSTVMRQPHAHSSRFSPGCFQRNPILSLYTPLHTPQILAAHGVRSLVYDTRHRLGLDHRRPTAAQPPGARRR